MKTSTTIRTIAVAALAMICDIMYSGTTETKTPNDTALCLRLKGKVSKTHESSGSTYTVQLVDNSTVVASQVVKAGKNFIFDAQKDRWYGLRIKKSECISKLISVSTHVAELEEGYMYEVIFEMEEPISQTEAGYLDADAIDFPLALISYEKGIDSFNYSEEYTKNIRKKLLTTFVDDGTNKEMLAKEITSKDDASKDQAELKNRQPIIK